MSLAKNVTSYFDKFDIIFTLKNYEILVCLAKFETLTKIFFGEFLWRIYQICGVFT